MDLEELSQRITQAEIEYKHHKEQAELWLETLNELNAIVKAYNI